MFSGFISKLLFSQAAVQNTVKMLPILIVLGISTILNAVYFMKTVIRIYTPVNDREYSAVTWRGTKYHSHQCKKKENIYNLTVMKYIKPYHPIYHFKHHFLVGICMLYDLTGHLLMSNIKMEIAHIVAEGFAILSLNAELIIPANIQSIMEKQGKFCTNSIFPDIFYNPSFLMNCG